MLPAGVTIIREFPDVPPILEAMVEGKPITAKASVFIPDDYRPDRSHPLLVFLQGGAGGDGSSPGEARSIVGRRGFVCANLPLFKRRIAPLAADRGNYWDRMFLTDVDAPVMWRGYAAMFDWIFALVPNLDRGRCCLGGFSNGAHTAASLLNRKAAQITGRFSRFLLVEGGARLRAGPRLAGLPLLMLQGADWERPWLADARRAARRSRAKLIFETMPGVSHGFPAAARKRVRRWLVAAGQGG